MAKNSARATKSTETKAAINAVTVDVVTNGVVDGDVVLIAAPDIKKGLVGLLTDVKSSSTKHTTAMRNMALCLMFGTIGAPEVLAADWSGIPKNDKSIACKVANYITQHGIRALVTLWNTDQATAQRKTPVNMSKLAKLTATKIAPKEAADGESKTTQSVVGRASQKAAEVNTPDLTATLGQIAAILADSIAMEKKIAKIGSLAAVKAAMEALVASEKEAA